MRGYVNSQLRNARRVVGTRTVKDLTTADLRQFLRDVISGKSAADVRTRASCDRQSRHFSVSLGMTLVAWTWKFPLSMATNRSNSRHYRHRMPGLLTLCRSPRLITANLVRTRVALVIRCPWNLRFDQTANMSRVCRSAAPANLNEWHRVLSVRTPLLVCP